MENIPQQQLLNSWKKGKALYASLFEFTDVQIRAEYRAHEIKLFNKSTSSEDVSKLLTISSGFAELSKTLQLSSALNTKRDQLKWDLLNKIMTEKVIGLGYEHPVKASDEPQIIPLHVWPQKIKDINWDDSSISKNGVSFSNIRLIKKVALKKADTNIANIKKLSSPKIKIEDKKIGRPSLKNKIIEAYVYLKKQGKIDYSKALSSHTELIQRAVQIQFPEITSTRGMETEAIRRAIGDMFKHDKKNL